MNFAPVSEQDYSKWHLIIYDLIRTFETLFFWIGETDRKFPFEVTVL